MSGFPAVMLVPVMHVQGSLPIGEDREDGKGQLPNAVMLNSFHGVPAPNYFPYPKVEAFQRPYACATSDQCGVNLEETVL